MHEGKYHICEQYLIDTESLPDNFAIHKFVPAILNFPHKFFGSPRENDFFLSVLNMPFDHLYDIFINDVQLTWVQML